MSQIIAPIMGEDSNPSCWPTDCVIVAFARTLSFVCVCASIMMCRALDCVCRRRRRRSLSQSKSQYFVCNVYANYAC